MHPKRVRVLAFGSAVPLASARTDRALAFRLGRPLHFVRTDRVLEVGSTVPLASARTDRVLAFGSTVPLASARTDRALAMLALIGVAACSPSAAPPVTPEAIPSASAAPSAEVPETPTASGSAAPAKNIPPEEPKILAFSRASDSGTVDRIGEKDGDFAPDGKNDLSFDVTVSGTVTALFVASVDGRGGASGTFQADTLVGKQFQPGELALAYQGGKTAGLAVYEGEKRLNTDDGGLPTGDSALLHSGTHTVRLYLSADPAAKPGKALRVYALGPKGEMVRGPTLDR